MYNPNSGGSLFFLLCLSVLVHSQFSRLSSTIFCVQNDIANADSITLHVCKPDLTLTAQPAGSFSPMAHNRKGSPLVDGCCSIFTAYYCLWVWALHLLSYLTPWLPASDLLFTSWSSAAVSWHFTARLASSGKLTSSACSHSLCFSSSDTDTRIVGCQNKAIGVDEIQTPQNP